MTDYVALGPATVEVQYGVKAAKKIVVPDINGNVDAWDVKSSSSDDGSGGTQITSSAQQTMTAAGGLGRAFQPKLVTNVALGAWSNAMRALVQCQVAGKATGLLSVVNAEIELPSSDVGSGTFAVYETEVVAPSGGVIQEIDLNYIAVSGANAGQVDDKAYLFTISGFSSGSAHMWFDQTEASASAANEWLRIKTPNGTKYLAVYDAVGSPS